MTTESKETDKVCICPGCSNKATKTPYSPYMNEYCDDCTYERHDITFGQLHPPVGKPSTAILPQSKEINRETKL